ncbi:alpha/beta hydrolase [Specibacter cremeus]|uniref:alpha/beta hydrolase n=1 Tax=Specibacter cremeus TaxID=1629051 RepID=UPI001F0C445B|nr:alpha/beta hydrolase [Specibacter cremeus]
MTGKMFTIRNHAILARPDDAPGTPALPWLSTHCPPALAGRPVFLVLPGGGYRHHAEHEGAAVAAGLNTLGLNAVVLRYSVAPAGYPAPLDDARAVLACLRMGASGLDVDTARIGVVGFSAGGHLAAALATGMGNPRADRPDLAVLCYPVISLATDAHEGSVTALLGQDAPAAQRRALSADRAVDARTPPTFLWHTADDDAVPVGNSLAYAGALAKAGVPVELHVFPHGRHGLGLARGDRHVGQWTTLCTRWLAGHGWLPAQERLTA